MGGSVCLLVCILVFFFLFSLSLCVYCSLCFCCVCVCVGRMCFSIAGSCVDDILKVYSDNMKFVKRKLG